VGELQLLKAAKELRTTTTVFDSAADHKSGGGGGDRNGTHNTPSSPSPASLVSLFPRRVVLVLGVGATTALGQPQALSCLKSTLPLALKALASRWPALDNESSRHHVVVMTQPTARTRLKGLQDERRFAVNQAVHQLIESLAPPLAASSASSASASPASASASASASPPQAKTLLPHVLDFARLVDGPHGLVQKKKHQVRENGQPVTANRFGSRDDGDGRSRRKEAGGQLQQEKQGLGSPADKNQWRPGKEGPFQVNGGEDGDAIPLDARSPVRWGVNVAAMLLLLFDWVVDDSDVFFLLPSNGDVITFLPFFLRYF